MNVRDVLPDYKLGDLIDPATAITLLPGFDPDTLAGDCVFDADQAAWAVEFFPRVLKTVKGTKSIPARSPFHLLPWQQAVVANLFGWYRPDGTRRFRNVFIYVPKKNGKTAFAAGLTVLVLRCDDEHGAEIYSAACSRDQAALVFQHAAGMVKMEPALNSVLRVYGDKGGSQFRSIVYLDQMSSYKCLAADGDTADGSNVHMAIIDEVHRHKKPTLADVLRRSTAARSQPIIVYTTTADYARQSLCNDLLSYSRSVRDNPGDPALPGHDPAWLPAVWEGWEPGEDGDYRDPEVWRRACPSLGYTVEESFYEEEVSRIGDMPAELNSFLRLHLNVVTDASVSWISAEKWDGAHDPDVTRETCEGMRCTGGLDLSSTLDLTSFVLFGEDDQMLSWFWIPEATAHKREELEGVPYWQWKEEGWIRFTPGEVIDYDFVREDINALMTKYDIEDAAADRWCAQQIMTQLEGDGLPIVGYGQGYKDMSPAAKEFERRLLASELRHDGNPVLRYCVLNVMLETDAAGNIKPSKKKSTARIDGAVAGCMAVGRRTSAPEVEESVYEARGFRSL